MFARQQKNLSRARSILGDKSSRIKDIKVGYSLLNTKIINILLKYMHVGLSISDKKLYLIICFALIILVCMYFFKISFLGIFVLSTALLGCLAYFIRSIRKFKRIQNFERDYPTFLLALASSVRTGLDPLMAMIAAVPLFVNDSEIKKELLKFKLQIENGFSEEVAIRDFGIQIHHPDIQLFRIGYLLSRREGSSLAVCLQRLARVTRQRQSFRRKVKAAVTMQRLSAFGISGCAVLVCFIESFGNPKIISDAISHPIGERLLISGSSLIIVGLFWMLKMTRSTI